MHSLNCNEARTQINLIQHITQQQHHIILTTLNTIYWTHIAQVSTNMQRGSDYIEVLKVEHENMSF